VVPPLDILCMLLKRILIHCISFHRVWYSVKTSSNATRVPVVFVSHGGGPSFFIDGKGSPLSSMDMHSEAKKSLERLPKMLNAERPSAIVVVSGHWEGSSEVLVTGKDTYPELYYDYGGFPDFTYKLEYKAPAEPQLAERIVQLLKSNNVPAALDKSRNWDHGVFIPLKVMYPKADIPVVEVSILKSFNPSTHIAMGKALAPLRNEGVLIMGSGFATHNFRGDPQKAKEFTVAVEKAITTSSPEEREEIFINWTKMPGARDAHGREDHLIPFHVVLGAAGEDQGKQLFKEDTYGMVFAHWAFGV